jgi:hypothetical protein
LAEAERAAQAEALSTAQIMGLGAMALAVLVIPKTIPSFRTSALSPKPAAQKAPSSCSSCITSVSTVISTTPISRIGRRRAYRPITMPTAATK